MNNHYKATIFLFIVLLTSCFEKEKIRHEALLNKHKFPSDYMYLQRSYPNGEIDKEAFRQGYIQAKKLESQSKSRNGEWANAGPVNIGGRIVDIEGVGSTIYACTASGGIFKTDNNGQDWSTIFDDEITLSIGDMAISHTDPKILYVGTGEANAGGGSLAYDGEGMYKSLDGGDTWLQIGLQDVGSIGRVAIDPTDDDIVYVAAMGTLFKENTERGIFRTKDGGETWEKVLYVSPKTGGIDVVINPENPNIVYAALWERERLLYDRTYGGPTSGIFKSQDGGDTWTELSNGLPNINMGRIGIAIAPSDPEILYTTIAASNGPLLGIYRTEDEGATWQERSIDNIQNVPYMWWFGRIKVHPTDPNKVYHIGFNMKSSNDGGLNWNFSFPGAHVDQHEVWINPDNPDQVFLGNDGGVYLSNDGGSNYSKIDNMPITQFYRCEVDFLAPERLYGGSQDNSTVRTMTGSNDDWEIINGGDGFTALVDPTNNSYVYATSQYGNMRRSVDGGNSFQSGTLGVSSSDPNNWNTPYVFDPDNPSIMYYGTNRLYRSTNRAEFWQPISEDLSNGPYTGLNPFGTITSISVSPFDTDQILVGTDDGNVWITNNLGVSWDKLSDDLPNRWVTSISHHPTLENRFYVTFSGYRYGENSAYAYSMNYPSEEWESISEGLPQVPINDLLVLPNTGEKVIASDVGVFISGDDNVWESLSGELPNVIITDLDYHEPEDKLIVATFGRSMYTYTFDENVGVEDVNNATRLNLSPNPTRDYVKVDIEEVLKITNVRITTIEGKKVDIAFNTKRFNTNKQLDVSSLESGTYVLTVFTEQKVLSETFVVLRD